MKRLMMVATASIFALALTACGEHKDAKMDTTPAAETTTVESTEAPASEAMPAAEPAHEEAAPQQEETHSAEGEAHATDAPEA